MFLYIGSRENTVGIFQVDDETGSLIRTVELIQVVERSLLPPRSDTFFSRFTSNFTSPSTEWMIRHPFMDLIYVFVGFYSLQESLVTTYQVDRQTGILTKLGVCSTGGLQATYATFSKDCSLLVVSHQNDGRLSFFDCNISGGVLEAPSRVVETPELRPETRCKDYPNCLPSLQHCQYTPDGKYLMTVDCSKQSRVWNYPVDERGMLLSDHPTSNLKAQAIQSPPGALLSFVASQIFQSPGRVRRVAFHPTGRYVYILYETHSVIQVYELSKGRILADCLQEIPTMDPSFFDRSPPPWKQKMTGMAANMASELLATEHGVWVSNRGLVVAGHAENSIRFFEYQEGGARLIAKTRLDTQGPVRHFCLLPTESSPTTIVAGISKKDPGIVETFAQVNNEFQKVGDAVTGLEVLCILTVPEQGRHV